MSTDDCDSALDSRDVALAGLLSSLAIPSVAGSAGVWQGADGPYVNTITNNAGEDVALVAWNNGQFKLDASSPPAFTTLIPNGQSVDVSMSDSYSGAMTVVHPDTELSMSGIISNTLIEMTTGEYGVVDISREVNMAGTNITVAQDKCTTSMDQCVFTCNSGASTCWLAGTYDLTNCATGSQPGASYGEYAGAPSGGCMIESKMTTTINPSS